MPEVGLFRFPWEHLVGGNLFIVLHEVGQTLDPAVFVDERIAHDPVEPRAGVGAFLELVEEPEGLEEGFLEQIICRILIAGQVQPIAIQHIHVRYHDRFKLPLNGCICLFHGFLSGRRGKPA